MPIANIDRNRPGIESQALTQGFEGALLGAPEQSYEGRPEWSRHILHQQLFFSSEIITHKRVKARLDRFQVATHYDF